MTVWNFPYRKRYYLTHPWKWFGQIGRNIRAAYNRTTKGYCSWDWMDLDSWFITVIPMMLRDMAMYGCAYPANGPFDTPEKWKSWLNRMADQLTYLQNEDNGNEYYEQFIKILYKTNSVDIQTEKTEEEQEIKNKYIKRSYEVEEEHRKLFKETMLELIEHWDCLWD